MSILLITVAVFMAMRYHHLEELDYIALEEMKKLPFEVSMVLGAVVKFPEVLAEHVARHHAVEADILLRVLDVYCQEVFDFFVGFCIHFVHIYVNKRFFVVFVETSVFFLKVFSLNFRQISENVLHNFKTE